MKPHHAITFSQAVAGWTIAAQARRLSPHTLADYANSFRKFQAFLRGDPDLRAIGAGDVEHFMAGLDGLSAKTALNIHTALSSLWHWALDEHIVERNVVRDVAPPDPDIMARPPRDPKEKVFTKDVVAFLAIAVLMWSPIFLFIFFHDLREIVHARTELFYLFLFVELVIALNSRSLRYSFLKLRPHKWLVIAVLSQVVLTIGLWMTFAWIRISQRPFIMESIGELDELLQRHRVKELSFVKPLQYVAITSQIVDEHGCCVSAVVIP